MKLKLVSLVLILATLLAACGNTILRVETATPSIVDGNKNTQDERDAAELIKEFSLPYYATDSLEPYLTKTVQNFSLRTLIYDSLFSYDGTEARPLIANSIVQNDSSAVVTLRDDVVFSDGTRLTAKEVVDSFKLAMASDIYSASLTELADVREQSSTAIHIDLKKPSPLLSNVLTFPIVKRVGEKSLGTGRFYLVSENKLVKNPYNKLEIKTVKQINLRPIKSLETLNFELVDGTVSLYYSDLSKLSDIGMGVGFKQVPLNNLVFLDFNSARVPLLFRKVIYHQLDRKRIAEVAYDGFATTVTMPVKRMAGVSVPNFSAEDELERAGYKYSEDGMLTAGGQGVKLRLLVTKEEKKLAAARLIAEQLDRLGIEVLVEQLDYTAYIRRTSAGDYDMVLGELRLSDDEDLAPILNGQGEADILGSYYQYQQKKLSVEDFSKQFAEQLPFCPILFRNGALFYNRSFQTSIAPNAYDIFYNIHEW